VTEIKLVDIREIDKDRIREDLQEDGILELMESIRNVGLFNPIIIDRTNKLIAGRRRIEAFTRLERESIPFLYFEDLDPIQQKIVEFDENTKRRQLTWQESSKAIAEIHRLMSKRDRSHTLGETAAQIGASIGFTSEALQLSDALGNERVAAQTGRHAALKTYRRERELDLSRELARRRRTDAEDQGVNPKLKVLGRGRIHHGDCLDVIKEMPDETVDLIFTDPPWGIDIHTASQWTKKWNPSYSDSTESIREHLAKLFPHLFRVLRPGRHVYIFFAIQYAEWLCTELDKVGFRFRDRPLIWFKTGQPSITETYTSFLPCYEAFFFAWKPGEGDYRRFFSKPTPEALGLPRSDGIWHEHDKPINLLEPYIEASSDPNELILDPFTGGGSTLAASFGLGRTYVGIEKDEVSFSKCCERMTELESGKRLG
jgi:ParB/RepB/Spo0J family partition protein